MRAAIREEFPPATLAPEIRDALESLKRERERMGLSLTDVAERSGIDRATLSKLENGRQVNPTLGTLNRYAAALGKRLGLVVQELEPASREGR